MKTENHSEISRFATELRTSMDKLTRASAALAECRGDAEQLRKRIEKIGVPSYKDDKAINELNSLTQKEQLVNHEIGRIEERIQTALAKLHERVCAYKPHAYYLLVPICDQRIKTISSVIRPFSNSDASAVALAKQTDACAAAGMAMRRLDRTPEDFETEHYANLVISIFEEALKNDGDLMQFLVPKSPGGVGQSETQAVEA